MSRVSPDLISMVPGAPPVSASCDHDVAESSLQALVTICTISLILESSLRRT